MNDKTDTVANELNYSVVNSYWKKAAPSIMGPYMMEGFGFPASAGHFRFLAEKVIVQQLLHNAKVDAAGAALDLGSGVGYWAEFFALKFNKVIAVEASTSLYESMVQRCATYKNFTPIHGDVMSFEPEGRFSLIFLGGLLMYLNENDVITLLQKLKPLLSPGGIILCRESTVRNGILTRDGAKYQAVYRSVSNYQGLFSKCNLTVTKICLNAPYTLMQMGCELIKKWKTLVPNSLQIIPAVGHLAYCGLRLGNPWIIKIPSVMGVDFPELTNHFFVVRAVSQSNSSNETSSAIL